MKIHLPLLLLCFSSLWATPPLRTIPTADMSALREPSRRMIENVHKALDEALADPNSPDGYLAEGYGGLGNVYQAHNFPEQAEAAYLNAGDLVPDDPRWPYFLGMVYISMGRYDDAEPLLKKVLQLSPGDLSAQIRLGEVYLELGRPAEAKAMFNAVLKQSEDLPVALFGKGRAALAEKNADVAVAALSKVAELQPFASEVNYPLGMAYRLKGDMANAKRYLQARGSRNVEFADPRLGELGSIITASRIRVLQDMAEAGQEFSGPDFVRYLRDELVGRRGVASFLQRFLREKSGMYRARPEVLGRLHFAVGFLLDRGGAREQAFEHYRAAVGLAPSFDEPHIEIAQMHLQRGAYARGLSEFERVLTRDPRNAAARLGRLVSLVQIGDLAKVKEEFDTGLPLLPQHSVYQDAAARFLANAPNPAWRDVDRALTLASDLYSRDKGPIYAETYAAALAASGRLEEAVRIQEKALAGLAPTSPATIRRRYEANLKLYKEGSACCDELGSAFFLAPILH